MKSSLYAAEDARPIAIGTLYPVDDPLHMLMEEEDEMQRLEYEYQNQKHLTVVSYSELFHPISSHEIYSLSQYEAPPPELWITAKVTFYLLALYFFNNSSIYIINKKLLHYPNLVVNNEKHQFFELLETIFRDVINQSGGFSNGPRKTSTPLNNTNNVSSPIPTSGNQPQKPSTASSEAFANGLYSGTGNNIIRRRSSVMRLNSATTRLIYRNSHDLLAAFTWKGFKSLLQHDKAFAQILHDMEKGKQLELLYLNEAFDSYRDKSLYPQDFQSLQQEYSDIVNNKNEVSFYSLITKDDMQILRELIQTKTFHPSSSLYFSKACAHLCATSRRITNHIYQTSLDNSLISHHKTTLKNVFHATPSQNLFNYVVCIDDCIDTASNIIATTLSLTQSYENVEFLLVPTLNNDNAVYSLTKLIQSISSSPFHRLLDCNQMKFIDKQQNQVKYSLSFKKAKKLQQNENEKEFDDIMTMIDKLSVLNKLDSLNGAMSNVTAKGILQYYKSKAKGDVMVVPLEQIYYRNECSEESISFTKHKYDDTPRDITPMEDNMAAMKYYKHRISRLILLSNRGYNSSLPNRYIVGITNSPNSLLSFQLALKLSKPSDIVIPFHLPSPTIVDIEFVLNLESNKNINNPVWPEFTRVKYINDCLRGRVNRLVEEYKVFGYNLLIGEYPESKDIIHFCGLIEKDTRNTQLFYHAKSEKIISMFLEHCSPNYSNYILLGGSSREINQIARLGLDHLTKKYDSTHVTQRYSSLTTSLAFEIAKANETSIILTTHEQ